MEFKKLYLNTLITEFPNIINSNNQAFKNYLDIFYNAEQDVLIKPINTQGNIKGSTAEFVNAIIDNLIIKKQFVNRYENISTADYDYYNMLIGQPDNGRDPITYPIDISVWNTPYEPIGYKITEVKPYLKISNQYSHILLNSNVSQIVGIYLDPSTIGSNFYRILLDPCTNSTYEKDISYAGNYVEFICINSDPSWGSTWVQYKHTKE